MTFPRILGPAGAALTYEASFKLLRSSIAAGFPYIMSLFFVRARSSINIVKEETRIYAGKYVCYAYECACYAYECVYKHEGAYVQINTHTRLHIEKSAHVFQRFCLHRYG